jgi:hypothetical protein
MSQGLHQLHSLNKSLTLPRPEVGISGGLARLSAMWLDSCFSGDENPTRKLTSGSGPTVG